MMINSRAYHKNVIDHYENPWNVGSLDKNDPKVGTGLVGAPACGDVMKLQIEVDDEGTINNAVFKVSLLIVDIWVWKCHCQLKLRHRNSIGNERRRSVGDQEFW